MEARCTAQKQSYNILDEFSFNKAMPWLWWLVTDLSPRPKCDPRSFEIYGGIAIHVHAWRDLDTCRRFRLPDFRQSVHEVGKVVSPTHRPSLPPVFLALISIGGRVEPRDIVRPEGLCKGKIPTTDRNEAQCLNQLPHRVPRDSWGTN
jgi:hypothetical protein